MNNNLRAVQCSLSPNLALIKYWGKRRKKHIPATTSIGVALNKLRTSTTVAQINSSQDIIQINNQQLSETVIYEHYRPFLDLIRQRLRVSHHFFIDMILNFPLAAGLASSSSIFGALALALPTLCDVRLPSSTLSSLARLGSTSAARTIFGDFVILPAGARYARVWKPISYWSDLRVIVAITDHARKQIATRAAMHLVQRSSFAYRGWLWSAQKIVATARKAIQKRNLEQLGEAMRASYLGMHATMLAARPPIIYWNARTLDLLHLCQELRLKGIEAWETMDAGPQVKILTRQKHVARIAREIKSAGEKVEIITSTLGAAPQLKNVPFSSVNQNDIAYAR